MTIEQFLQQNTQKLGAAGIGTARLDVLVLLEDCLNTNRTQLLAHSEQVITNEQLKLLNTRISRRAEHEPLAYIRGKTEFYGREFIINKNVLEPRPESETMIEILLNSRSSFSKRPRIADVGTGSGALGITAKLELPESKVDLIEVDKKAMSVARKNVKKFDVDVRCIENDLFTGTKEPHDTILANLPYVPDNYQINAAAGAEPRIAIFGGIDGLDIYRRLFAQLKSFDWKPKLILAESMPPQHALLEEIAAGAGFTSVKSDDFIQQFIPSTQR